MSGCTAPWWTLLVQHRVWGADPLRRVAVDYICSVKLFSLPHKDKRRRLSTAAGSGERAAPLCSQNERGRKWVGGRGRGANADAGLLFFLFVFPLIAITG